jgi:hypothetical protein
MEAANAIHQCWGRRPISSMPLAYFGEKVASWRYQSRLVDRAANALYPDVQLLLLETDKFIRLSSAVLRHVHIATPIKRPKGAQGNQRTRFLTIEEFDRLEEADPPTQSRACCALYAARLYGFEAFRGSGPQMG